MDVGVALKGQHKGFSGGCETVPFPYCGSGYMDPPRKWNCREFHSILNLVQVKPGKPETGELYYCQNSGCDTQFRKNTLPLEETEQSAAKGFSALCLTAACKFTMISINVSIGNF